MAFFLLCIYLIIVLIRPQDFVESMQGLPIVMYTLIVTTIPFFFAKKNTGSPQLVFLALMLVVIAISAILSGWSGSIIKLVPEFASTAVIPFMLFSKLIDTPKKHKAIIIITILAALIMVHNGISQKQSEVGIGWAGSKLSEGTRITYLGNLGDPNDLGMFFVMTIPLIVYCILRSGGIFRLIWCLSLVALLYGIFLTNSRGSFLGVVSLISLWMLLNHGIKKSIFAGIFFLPIVILVASKFRTIDSQEDSAAGRIEAWYEGFQMLIGHPLFGVGMGGFTDIHRLTAHNSYVLVAAELGIIGFTLWMSFLALTFFMLYKLSFYDKALKVNPGKQGVEGVAALPSAVQEDMLLAKVSYFSLLGFAVTAFFLSRCYAVIPYIYIGVAASTYFRALPMLPELNVLKSGSIYSRLILFSMASIVILYFVVKILV